MTKKKLSPWKNNFEFIQSLKPETNFILITIQKNQIILILNWAAFPGKDGFQ